LSYPIPEHNNAHYGLWRDGLWRHELACGCLYGTGLLAFGRGWYSALFSKAWRSAIEQHRVKLGQPNQSGMGTKLIVTLVCNLIAALVLARVIHQLHGVDLLRGLKIGAGVGIGFCATALTMTYVWQSPPRRLWAIDTGYHIVGCLIMGAILSVWR
jgi:Protein of unknown function (DUF1761)